MCLQSDRALFRRLVHLVLTETGEKNEELKAVRAALGMHDDLPSCDGHLVVNAVIATGGSLTSIFISENTKETLAIADQSNPVF